jgi:hypothetical protein
MSDYSECDRLVAVAPESHKLGEFLDWLNEQGIHLASYEEFGGCEDAMLVTRTESYERLLARYFNIDLDKVETERRALLKALQEKSVESKV